MPTFWWKSVPRKVREIVAGIDWAPATLQQVEESRVVSASARSGIARARDSKPHRESSRAARAVSRHHEYSRLAAWQSRASALGRGCGAVPGLCQLHIRLPDLLLRLGRGRERLEWRQRAARKSMGFVLHDGTFVHEYGSRPQNDRVALPAMAHAQTRNLDRPIRDKRLRRLRAMHHLVPGGDRHNGGSGGHSSDRWCGIARPARNTPNRGGQS